MNYFAADPKAQRDRLEAASQYTGRAVVDLLREALMRKLLEVEAEIEANEAKKRDAFVPRTKREWNPPKGLGLGFELEPARAAKKSTAPSSPSVISPSPKSTRERHPQPDAAWSNSVLDGLVAFVAEATDKEEQAARVLAVMKRVDEETRSPAEAAAIAARLDTLLQALLQKKSRDPRFGLALELDEY